MKTFLWECSVCANFNNNIPCRIILDERPTFCLRNEQRGIVWKRMTGTNDVYLDDLLTWRCKELMSSSSAFDELKKDFIRPDRNHIKISRIIWDKGTFISMEPNTGQYVLTTKDKCRVVSVVSLDDLTSDDWYIV